MRETLAFLIACSACGRTGLDASQLDAGTDAGSDAGSCGPAREITTVATTPAIGPLVLSGRNLYFPGRLLDSGNGYSFDVRTLDKCTGNLQKLAPPDGGSFWAQLGVSISLESGAGFLFWNDAVHVWQRPLTNAPSPLNPLGNVTQATKVLFYDDLVYLNDFAGSYTVYSVDPHSGVQTLVKTDARLSLIDKSNFYFVEKQGQESSLAAAPRNGDPEYRLLSCCHRPDLLLDGDFIYFSFASNGPLDTLFRISITSGQPQPIVSAWHYSTIGADNQFVYGFDDRAVVRVAKASPTVEVVATLGSDQESLEAVLIQPEEMFWVLRGRSFDGTSRVMKGPRR